MVTFTNAHALLIGIRNYKNIKKIPLVKDVQAIHELLTNSNFCGYPSDNVCLLLDEDATQARIRQELNNVAERCDTDSTIFIYFSGHGGHVETGLYQGEYLLPVDCLFPNENYDELARTSIAGSEFTQALGAIKARKVTVILDCCHAAGVAEPKDATEIPLKMGLSNDYLDKLGSGEGRVVIASCDNNEKSWIMPGADYSLFTQHLLSGFRGGAASEDGFVRIFDLFEFVQPKVTEDMSVQHPTFSAKKVKENYPVALYLGGKSGAIEKDDEGFRYAAYISYVDKEPDATWVWEKLVPRLKAAGIRVSVSGDVEEPGVYRVVNIERGIEQAKRTIIVISEAYLADSMATFENVLAQSLGIGRGEYRVLPIRIDKAQMPERLNMLVGIDLSNPARVEHEFDRLVEALRRPLPHR